MFWEVFLRGGVTIVQVFSYTIVDKASSATSSGPCFSKTNLNRNQSHSPRLSLSAEKVSAGEILSPEFHLLAKNKKINAGNTRATVSLLNEGIFYAWILEFAVTWILTVIFF